MGATEKKQFRAGAVLTLSAALAIPLSVASAPSTHAVSSVSVRQETGTPGWDGVSDITQGMDASATDNVIRVNDYITYWVEVGTSSTTQSTTIELSLPQGYEVLPAGTTALNALPPTCGAGSSVTSPSAPPGPGLTATSYQSLTSQTVTCVTAGQGADSLVSYPIIAKVRSELPPGGVDGGATGAVATATVTTDAGLETEQVVTDVTSPESFVASAPRWNLTTTGVNVTPGTGFNSPLQLGCPSPGTGTPPSPFTAASPCTYIRYFYSLHAENGGKGAMPLTDNGVRFTWDLSPEAVYSPHTDPNSASAPSTTVTTRSCPRRPATRRPARTARRCASTWATTPPKSRSSPST